MRIRVAGRRGSPEKKEVVRMPEQEVNTEMEQPPEHTFDAIHDNQSIQIELRLLTIQLYRQNFF